MPPLQGWYVRWMALVRRADEHTIGQAYSMERQQSAVDVGDPEPDADTLQQIGGCFWWERLCDLESSNAARRAADL